MTDKEEKMIKCINQIIVKNHLVGCVAGDYLCDGICLNKENNEWVVSLTSRNHIDLVYGRFPQLLNAGLFFMDQIFSSFQESAKAKEALCELWQKNVPNFINV